MWQMQYKTDTMICEFLKYYGTFYQEKKYYGTIWERKLCLFKGINTFLLAVNYVIFNFHLLLFFDNLIFTYWIWLSPFFIINFLGKIK